MEEIPFVAPPEADVGAVEHVGDDDGFDAGVRFFVRFFHGGAGSGDDQRVAVMPGDLPIAVLKLYIPQMNTVHTGFRENDNGVFGKLTEGV